MNKYFDEEVIEKFCYNELSRRNLDDRQRGMACKGMLDMKGITQSELAKEFNVHRARISDWISAADSMDEEEYEEMKSNGATKFDINRELRSRTRKDGNLNNIRNDDRVGVILTLEHWVKSKKGKFDARHTRALNKLKETIQKVI